MGISSSASPNNTWQTTGVTGVRPASGKQAQETFCSSVGSQINKFKTLMAIYLCQKAAGQPVTWGQAHLLVLRWSTKGSLQQWNNCFSQGMKVLKYLGDLMAEIILHI